MMLLIFGFMVMTFCQRIGPWEITFLDSENCQGDLQAATQYSDQCISISEGSMSETFMYSCSRSSVSQAWYAPGVECADPGPYKHVHVADTYKCQQNGDGSSTIWKCWEDYSMNYTNALFIVGMNPEKPPEGSNPGVGAFHHPFVKCRKHGSKHLSLNCDPKTNEGLIEVYRSGLCLKAEQKTVMKKGDLIDFKYITGDKIWMIYDGCYVKK